MILWGALVRATGSGAGCGSHWPLCNGEVVPRAPATQTIIEFTHRLTSGLALIGVVILLVWAFRAFPKKHLVRTFATLSLVLVVVEALLGAGLVLLQYVEQNASVGRAIYLSAHLANTQLLLAALALTGWYSLPNRNTGRFSLGPFQSWGVLLVLMIAGISGAIAALGDTLFPSASLAEGLRQDASDTAHYLLRLRIFHPALAIFSALYVGAIGVSVLRKPGTPDARQLARYAMLATALQMVLGLVNLWLLAPVWMQLVHLFFADVLWVVLVLLVVETAAPSTLP